MRINNTQQVKIKQGEGYCTYRIESRSLAGARLRFCQDNLSAQRYILMMRVNNYQSVIQFVDQ